MRNIFLRSLLGTDKKIATSDKQPLCSDAPDDYGLLITLCHNSSDNDDDDSDENDTNSENNSGRFACRIDFVPDQHLDMVHPHAYGPASLTDLKRLGGGGSGVTVFQGQDTPSSLSHSPGLGDLIMKHGGYKDTKELFALAKIARELAQRRRSSQQVIEAADDMQSRLPEFRMMYISPKHLWKRPTMVGDVWNKVAKTVKGLSSFSANESSKKDPLVSFAIPDTLHGEISENEPLSAIADSMRTVPSLTTTADVTWSDSGSGEKSRKSISNVDNNAKKQRNIQLYSELKRDVVKVSAHSDRVAIYLGNETKVLEDSDTGLWYGLQDGFDCLERLNDDLRDAQKKFGWKFTLAQKAIGNDKPKTAAKFLSEGRLEGPILESLIREEIRLIRNLQILTKTEEGSLEMVDQVRKELDEKYRSVYAVPSSISDTADRFVGMAVRKNWDPTKGRFHILRRMGEAFRQKSVTLTVEEKAPARYLGLILDEKTKMSDVFADAPNIPTAITSKGCAIGSWKDLLRDAAGLKSHDALRPIWNCGVVDGGLHNMFLSEDRAWYFDLGEPTLQPLPAFLTKFLFSFFHTLGMVDSETEEGWVNRFEIPKDRKVDKLGLTSETRNLIPKAYEAFAVTLDRLIEEFFEGEEAARELMLNYVTLQLLSDAAFCLERWTAKGGGQPRNQNHHKHIEEWLWRSLWDVYIATDLNRRSRRISLGIGKSQIGWRKPQVLQKRDTPTTTSATSFG